MVNVLDALEPRQPAVVDVVRLVIEHGEFINLAHDFAQVSVAVGGLADRFGPERREEVVAQVIVLQRGLGHLAEIDPVDVGQEQVAGRPDDTHIILDMQRHLEIVAPVVAGMAVVGEYRIIEEDAQPVEVTA